MEEVYYIRPPDSETARGPFDLEKLGTLAEAGQVTRETLYFDESLSSWAAIGSNAKLTEQVFPSKKRLTLRERDKSTSTSEMQAADETRSVISVEEMLAAAEGKTEETRHVREEILGQHRAASLAIPVLGVVCLVSALTYIYPAYSTIQSLIDQRPDALQELLQRPLLILGALDLFFAICLFLAATEIYRLLRFRAALGMGFFGFLYWSEMINGQPEALYLALSSVAYGIGVFTATLTLNLRTMIGAGIVSIAGASVFAYFTTFAPIIDRWLK